MEIRNKYICSECAKEGGGVWRESALAVTWHLGVCDVCELKTGITASRHWKFEEEGIRNS